MTKEEKYQEIIPQIRAVGGGETDLIANMANIAAVLHEAFRFWWTGFYLVRSKDDRQGGKDDRQGVKDNGQGVKDDGQGGKELVLGPFQGPIACTRIPYGKGVCGTAWQRGETVIVANVHDFPGHIACSSASKSEIVVPIRRDGEVIAVLDIDSAEYNTFDLVDKTYLEQISL